MFKPPTTVVLAHAAAVDKLQPVNAIEYLDSLSEGIRAEVLQNLRWQFVFIPEDPEGEGEEEPLLRLTAPAMKDGEVRTVRKTGAITPYSPPDAHLFILFGVTGDVRLGKGPYNKIVLVGTAIEARRTETSIFMPVAIFVDGEWETVEDGYRWKVADIVYRP